MQDLGISVCFRAILMDTAEDVTAMRAGLATFHRQMEELEDMSVRLCSPGGEAANLASYIMSSQN